MRSRIVVLTIAAWAAIAFVYEGARIWVVLSGPPVPDLYANSLSFQLLASLYLLVGFWVPVLAGVLLFEMLIFAAGDRGRIASSSSLAFTACSGRYSLFAESFRCRQPHVALVLAIFFFAASLGCMWARRRAKAMDARSNA
jgi:hypothetical protein